MKKRIIWILLAAYLFSYAPFFSLLEALFFSIEENIILSKIPMLPEDMDYMYYKNGEEVLSTTGECYMLHNNQWIPIVSKEEYEKILEEVPLILRNIVIPRKSTQNYNQKFQMKMGGNTILNSLRNANKLAKFKGEQLLNGKSNAMQRIEKIMEVHDEHVIYRRRKSEERRIYIEKRQKTLSEWENN